MVRREVILGPLVAAVKCPIQVLPTTEETGLVPRLVHPVLTDKKTSSGEEKKATVSDLKEMISDTLIITEIRFTKLVEVTSLIILTRTVANSLITIKQ
jgi:hypothetical protein